MTDQRSLSRRNFIVRTTLTGFALTGAVGAAHADGHLPKLDPEDPTAKALSYTHESAKADQNCRNCQLFQGSKQWGACTIFPGKEVNANGWCSAWVKKSS